ncbi:F-box/FBD/LRR-repeat protein At1g13570 [Aegilops tauschii subsp. strangulata]|uniref:At1g61320/AtMIF1 LRR domain-containing protein n=2 Tax=Aegilops tauschii subsp. strangulata TaxID=200361 RepID=A0A453L8G8_AEGTS|nr:F-box/FBD/LRR-repeat protein At1g13570 [Aegilops tauschii subsp. strangulata]
MRLLMSRKRHRLRCRRRIRDRGPVALVAKRKSLRCQQDDNYHVDRGISCPDLPEDILRHIHAKMTLRDAARATCASHAFRHNWICRPNLTFSLGTLGLNRNASRDVITRDLISKIDLIMQNHSGIGVKTLDIDLYSCDNIDFAYLDSWLRIAVTPGIEELILTLPLPSIVFENALPIISVYNFPCSLLSNGSGNSIQYLNLCYCTLRPTAGLGCLRSLTRLHMSCTRITGDELWCLLSNSPALVCLKLLHCEEIISLKIPSLLQRLRFLEVAYCDRLQVVESNAPNLTTFYFAGFLGQISLGGSLQLKTLRMICFRQTNIVCYARQNLLSIAPNVETLTISSLNEMVNTPMLSSKFLHLKLLQISLVGMAFSRAYDYLSLVSFVDASPCLENFVLAISQHRMGHASILGEPSHDLRQIPQQRHAKLKSVTITGFCSAKSLVELTCHILENTTSLDCLTLDTTCHPSCAVTKFDKCHPLMDGDSLVEAQKALLAIRRYVLGKVPSMVKLNILEPCSRCHAVESLVSTAKLS